MNDQIDRQCIKLHNYRGNENVLLEILAGMEEEGIPYEVKNIEFEDVIKQAYDASQESRMGIGIAIKGTKVVLHYVKLKEREPLIVKEIDSSHWDSARIIGCNAARLYKIMPFKSLNEKLQSDENIEESIRKIVIDILEKFLKEGCK